MLRVAIYTLTRERVEYTKKCFQSLWDNAGAQVDHYVFDNGSQDGTAQWLNENKSRFKWLHLNPTNVGISKASNACLNEILKQEYDIIIKMDNDCFIETKNIIGVFSEIFSAYQNNYLVISPSVNGLERTPPVKLTDSLGEHVFSHTNIVGGLFHVTSPKLYTEKGFRYNEHLPLGKGQDDEFCSFARAWGGVVGYVHGVWIQHYETTHGQSIRYPDYFKRKRQEEKI